MPRRRVTKQRSMRKLTLSPTRTTRSDGRSPLLASEKTSGIQGISNWTFPMKLALVGMENYNSLCCKQKKASYFLLIISQHANGSVFSLGFLEGQGGF